MTSVRRLLRIAFNMLTVLSLVLAILIAGLWVRSYWHRGYVQFSAGPKTVFIHSMEGRISITLRPGARPSTRGEVLLASHSSAALDLKYRRAIERREQLEARADGRLRYELGGFLFWHRPAGPGSIVRVPHSAMIIGLVLLSMVAAWRRLRTLAAFAGHCCSACGYDLRATPARCPECGLMPERASV